MIASIKIQNFALIESLNLDLSSGFSVITGETGAGKSIILNALNLVLGARADSNQILNKEKKCVIEVDFRLDNLKRELFESNDLDFYDENIFRREITPSGKSRMFVNDTPVNLQVLKSIGKELIEIHSQHQTYELKGKDFSLNLLDGFVIDSNELSEYREVYAELKSNEKLLAEKIAQLQNSKQEIDFLNFQLVEFEKVNFEEDFDEMQQRFDRSENASSIVESLNAVNHFVSEGDANVLQLLKSAQNAIAGISSLIENGDELNQRIQSALIDLSDLSNEIESLASSVEINPQEKFVLEEKLNLFNHLCKKHFVSNQQELKEIKSDIQSKLDAIDNSDEAIEGLKNLCAELHAKSLKLAKGISEKRKEIALVLQDEIKNQLKDLSMANATIKFDFEEKDLSKNGIDSIECLISVNKGMPLGKIEKTISGGEMSRFMLAVQTILSRKKALPTLIFDEIDTGVSGAVAEKMASKMKLISDKIQVLSITHLPQVASMGDVHYVVKKSTDQNQTTSTIVQLSQEERVSELASLLSGQQVSQEALENARNMLAQ